MNLIDNHLFLGDLFEHESNLHVQDRHISVI